MEAEIDHRRGDDDCPIRVTLSTATPTTATCMKRCQGQQQHLQQQSSSSFVDESNRRGGGGGGGGFQHPQLHHHYQHHHHQHEVKLDGQHEKIVAERRTFANARQYLNLGRIFRFVTYLYADRKLMVFFLMHFMATMIIWTHFALIKFEEQRDAVKEGAPFYWLKRIAPPLEFGSMHAILFQMALIPLSMSRYSIAALCDSFLNLFVPMNRAVRIHIHLGYTMVLIVFVATAFFFAFFGVVCAAGDQSFCDKFTSEIMCTGYGILTALLIVGGTSYFRHSIPYEIFYAIHHLVFVLYILTIVHTLDVEQRSNVKKRSQTFKWFSATLLYYVCDRAAMHIMHKYRARVVSSSRVKGSNGSRMVILKLRRPALFDFKPGQYAFLRMSEIDAHWHPFSIASGPASNYLEFYIEVFGAESWTGKLWEILEKDGIGGDRHAHIEMEIMGPYGTNLAKTEDYSHVLAIGTGTGIVPVLSLFKQHVKQLVRLDPDVHFAELLQHQKKVRQAETARAPRKGSVAKHLTSCCHRRKKRKQKKHVKSLRDSLKEKIRMSLSCREFMKVSEVSNSASSVSRTVARNMEMQTAAFQTTRSLYGVVLLSVLPVFGLSLIGLTISWNTIAIDPYDEMLGVLFTLSVVFQALFSSVAIFVWDANAFLTYIDMAVVLVTPFLDWFWFDKYRVNGVLRGAEIALYCLLVGYMTLRSWHMTVRPRHCGWRSGIHTDGGNVLERFEMIWSTRSSSLVSEIVPDINKTWESLVTAWGKENALRVCKIWIHVTDKDTVAVSLLHRELRETSLFRSGCIHLGRPDFAAFIENHTLDMICTRRNSYSLLTFCGSPELSREVHRLKIYNDMLVAITGNKHHQMESVSESYGGIKPVRRQQLLCDQQHADETDDEESGHMEAKDGGGVASASSAVGNTTAGGGEGYVAEIGRQRSLTTRTHTSYYHDSVTSGGLSSEQNDSRSCLSAISYSTDKRRPLHQYQSFHD